MEISSCKGDQNPLFPCENPISPEMEDINTRMKTFVKGWNNCESKEPILTIAKCGFYYTGVKGMLKCFYCAGKILNWEENDDFFVLHAKHYPQCEYLLRMIGPDLVTDIVKKYPEAIRPIVRNPCKTFQFKHIKLIKPIKEMAKKENNQEGDLEKRVKTKNE